MKLTTNERRILEVLAKRFSMPGKRLLWPRWWTPTEIGEACDKPHQRASSWACRYLCKLRDRRMVRREPPGEYFIKNAGLWALEGE